MGEFRVYADERLEFLSRNPPRCPECGTDQVQILDWMRAASAAWRCRHCKMRFSYEPPRPLPRP